MSLALDLLAPRRCVCCRAYDTWLCAPCADSLRTHTDQVCYYCKETPTSYGNLCSNCRGAAALRSIYVGTHHTGAQQHLLARVIYHYKYYFIEELAEPLGTLLAHSATTSALPVPDVIIPVPLHRRRLRWRGFNQSAHLATALSSALARPLTIPVVTDLLVRTRYTTPQVARGTRSARLHNLRNAFAVTRPADVRGTRILLVDDIATTGTTLLECGTVLARAGARSVDAIVLARGL